MGFDFYRYTVFESTQVGVVDTVPDSYCIGNFPAAIVPGKGIIAPVGVFIYNHKRNITAVEGFRQHGEIIPCGGYFICRDSSIVLIDGDKLFV